MKKIILVAFLAISSGVMAQKHQGHQHGGGACCASKSASGASCPIEMKEELGLTAEQEQKIQALRDSNRADMQKNRADHQKQMAKEMKKILTPEQYKKWEAHKKEMEAKRTAYLSGRNKRK